MIQLALSRGYFAIIDDEDEALSKHKWSVADCDGLLYARRGERGHHVYLHRAVLGFGPGDPLVDHRNGDGLDCRRFNLRASNKDQNARNSAPRSDNTSGFRGISLCKKTGRWKVYIHAAGKQIWLGFAVSLEEARRVRAEAEVRMYGIEPQRADEIAQALVL